MTSHERLRHERERLGHSQRAFAELVGVGKNSQMAYEGGTSPITLDYLDRAAQFGVRKAFVVLGEEADGDRIGANVTADIRRFASTLKHENNADLVGIGEIDLRYGLGATYLDSAVQVETRYFSRAWLRNFTSSPPEDLFWARGQGDSMERTIQDNDILLIDRRQNTLLTADLIWAFAFGQFGMIKRLRPMPNGSVKILSDNAAVPPETAVDDELHIVGRVVAIVKRV